MYITTADVNKAKEIYIMQIGKTIRKYRKEKGLTQEEITAMVMEANQRFKTSAYDEVFLWAKSTTKIKARNDL